MSPISRGFRGRRPHVDSARLPPGQHVVDDFPVLSAGSTPHTPLDDWTFEISGAVDQPVSWTWNELLALPTETPTVDIHCVTAWSKLGTTWTGVSVDTVLAGLETEAEYVSAWCDDGYRTNLPLEDVTCGRAWIAYEFAGEPVDPEHGGSPTPGPAPVFLEERQVGARTGASGRGPPRGSGRPPATTTTATGGRSSAMRMTDHAIVAPVDTVDHARGDPLGPVIVEYGDYECPYARVAFREIERVQRRTGNAVRFVFRHFPLTELHPHALAAAAAAEAAALQDQFWAIHALLFHRQNALADDYLRRYAAKLGLDVVRFDRDRTEPAALERVQRDVRSGLATGQVTGTPTLFIDGVVHRGSYKAAAVLEVLAPRLQAS